MGGKRLLAKKIAGLIPQNHTCYMEPFFGSGSVLFAKKRSRVEIANDIDGDLITLFDVVKNRHLALIDWFAFRVMSEKLFHEMVEWMPADPIDIAGRFLYINKMCFAGEVSSPYLAVTAKSGGASKHTFLHSIDDDIRAMHRRIAPVTFLNRRAEDVLPLADAETVVYVDPPYYGTRGYRNDVDWEALLEWVRTTPSRVIFSINKCEWIDKNLVPLFSGGDVMPVKVAYSMSKDKVGRKQGGEYIMTNFKAAAGITGRTAVQSDLSGTIFDTSMNDE